jgi:hypothetical protein
MAHSEKTFLSTLCAMLFALCDLPFPLPFIPSRQGRGKESSDSLFRGIMVVHYLNGNSSGTTSKVTTMAKTCRGKPTLMKSLNL